MNNPYTCRLLIRIDRLIYTLKGIKTHWSKNGKLIIGNGEAKSHFPGWMFRKAAKIQNKLLWTRKLLSI